MIYLVELSDKRNSLVLNKLKEKYAAEEFSFAEEKACPDNPVIVFSPARKLSAADAQKLPPSSSVLGGKQSAEVLSAILGRGIKYINMLEDEVYAVKNALLTAEGALAIVIGNTEKSIFENSVLILGCGRVGKATALLLGKTGIKTAVATFDKAEYDACAFYSQKAYFGYSFTDSLENYDVIINTIPKTILDDGVLQKISPGTIIVELASVNCLDAESAGKYPFKFIPAGGLPMKYSAESAAGLMLECITSLTK